ncbi:MAG TPA: DinB family protein [Ktedonobacteraceae bacterium]|nr:DinB family protein [Ktedonobacteraceae bacterium]
MDSRRRHWSQQQQLFREALFSKTRHDEAMRLLLSQHAMLHSAQMAGSGEWSFEDEVLAGLSDEQLRTRPLATGNSIAWLIWHVARIEDVTMNLLVAGRPQVFHEMNWPERLEIQRRDVGTSMSDSEVADFTRQVSLAALRAYRMAVGRGTRAIIAALQPAEVWERVDPERVRQLVAEDALAQGALDLARFWGGRRKAGILTMPATRHSYTHLSEARAVRGKLLR